MGNSCKGESKPQANGTERTIGKSGRKYLQTESTSKQQYKNLSKSKLIEILEESDNERKSEKARYERWVSNADRHYKEELVKARQQIREAANNLEVEKKNHEQRERRNKEKYMNELQVASQNTVQAEKKLADVRNRTELDRQMFFEEKSKLQKENKQLQVEKESLLSRFSAIAAAKLTDGNANIADLSDENRPTKISEMYSELYDNDWTDAFVYLTKDEKRSEEDACLILAKAFCNAYDVCKVKAKEDMEKVTEALTVFYECKEMPPETLKQMKDQRKRLFDNHSQTLMKKYKDQIRDIFQDEDDMNSEVVDKFLKKCVQICWLMAIQDPQVFVDTNLNNIGKHFDNERYKPYTKSGSYIGFIVWPTLYLHEGGGILMKGIAQGTSDQPSPDYENVNKFHKQNQDGEIKIPQKTSLGHANKNDKITVSSISKVAQNESLRMKKDLANHSDSRRKSDTSRKEKFGDWQNNIQKSKEKEVTVVSVKT